MKKNTILLGFAFAFLLVVAFMSAIAWADENESETADKIIIGVMPFVREKKEPGHFLGIEFNIKENPDDIEAWNILAREGFVQALVRSRRIATLKLSLVDEIITELGADESKFTDIDTALEIGQRLGARYMVLGKIMVLSSRTEARKKGFFPDAGSGIILFTSTLNMRLVDVETGKVVMDLSGYGSAGESQLETPYTGDWGNAPKWVKILGETLEDRAAKRAEDEQSGRLRKASVFDGGVELGNRLKEELGGEYLRIRAVKGKNHIEINADSYYGLVEGDIYLVYFDGNERHDDNGVFLGREKIPLAVINIDNINRGYSVAKLALAGGTLEVLREGDKIEPILREESKQLVVQKKFPKERPENVAQAAVVNPNGEATSTSPQEALSSLASPAPSATEAAAVTQAPVALAPSSPQASSLPIPSRSLENDSTDPAKVVTTYGLPSGEANTRRIAHLGARGLSGQKAYNKYVELATSYDGDYLAAYQAGEAARKLKQNDDAKTWYDKALAINPDYVPAQNAREKMK